MPIKQTIFSACNSVPATYNIYSFIVYLAIAYLPGYRVQVHANTTGTFATYYMVYTIQQYYQRSYQIVDSIGVYTYILYDCII